jgi:predicted DNA-binding protein with PD1-like motif
MIYCGPALRQAREQAGLSLSGLAKRAGYSRSYLGNVETGVRPATPAVIRAYERAVGEADSHPGKTTMYVVQVDKGEEVLAKLNEDLAARGLTHGSITLIGAIQECTISVMAKDNPLHDLLRSYDQPFELTGTGEVLDGRAHLHVVLAGEDVTVAGHLHSATVQDFFVRAYVTPLS